MITNFNDFLELIGDDDVETIEQLYNAIRGVEDYGRFNCSSREVANGKTQYFVKDTFTDEMLLLASSAAKETFLQKLENETEEKRGMSVEGAAWFREQMRKND